MIFTPHGEAQDGSNLLDRLQVGVAWAFFGAVLSGFGVAIYGGHPQVESIQAVSALVTVVLARSINYY